MDTIKAYTTLLDMATVPKKQENVKSLIEGKTSTITSVTTDEDEEESS
jgi:hypothetical protein